MMEIHTVLLIALALAMDAFAVSLATSMNLRREKLRMALRMPLSFGVFQAVMPLLGWGMGHSLRGLVESYDKLFAFAILTAVGLKMIYESGELDGSGGGEPALRGKTLLALSLATSIDALAVGVTFSFLGVSIIYPVIVIGVVTFLLCLAGILFGRVVQRHFEGRFEAVAGLILIGLGLKIFLEHTLLS